MANISSEIAEIQAASRGSEVRQPIVDALNKVNADVLPVVSSSDAGKFLIVDSDGDWEVGSGGLVPTPTETKAITQNGTHDVTNYASAAVNVPNSYSASDEGKVVDNGALVAQTSKSVTTNGTYDTTTNDEVIVNVSGGGGSFLPNVFCVGFFGSAAGESTNNIIININNFSGKYALISVMHRDNLSTPSGCTLLYKTASVKSDVSQWISVFKCAIDSNSKSIQFNQASSARINATVWVLDADFSIVENGVNIFQYYVTESSINSQELTFIIFNAYYSQTIGAYITVGGNGGAWLCLPTNEIPQQLRHFSGIIPASNNVKTTTIMQINVNGSHLDVYDSYAQLTSFAIRSA